MQGQWQVVFVQSNFHGVDMANDLLGQILGSVLAGGRQHSPSSGGLGDVLGGMLGRGGMPAGQGGIGGLGRQGERGRSGGGGGALMAVLLPLAMQWVQRNGGIGAVLERFREKGYGQQARSWMSTGPNETLAPAAVGEVVGMEELSRLSQQLGVGEDEIAGGMAEILPEVANHLSPDGEFPEDADDRLNSGASVLEELVRQFTAR